MMKKIIYKLLIASLGALLFLSCGEDEYIAPTQFAHPAITSTPTKVNLNGSVSFADLGQGVLSRTWTFPEGVADIIDSDDDMLSTNKIVHVEFIKPGEYEINYKADFVVDSVALDTMILVTVLDTITAKFTHNHSDLSKVEAGSKIQFTNASTGDPDTYEWIIEGGDPEVSADENPLITFKKLGTFDVTFIASRDKPYGRDTVTMKDYITVIPSSEPVTLKGISVTREDLIKVQYSRELQPVVGEEASFSISLAGSPATVSSVKLSSTDASIVEIELAEEIYNTDELLVTYTPGGLISTDFVKANAFTDVQPEMWMPNYFETSGVDVGFENGGANWKLPPWYDGGSGTLDVDAGAANTGSFGAKLTLDAESKLGGWESEPIISIEAGMTYKISYMIKVVSRGGIQEVNIRLLVPDPWSQVARIWHGDGSLNDTEWRKVENIVTIPADDARDLTTLKIAFQTGATAAGESAEIYIDDVSFVPWEVR
ncbi:carbohydrate binding domain-containing protein [Flammeovirgaceae bacterium SG7u.111]|nr:carbohydrate binding domain-containing protein [Flammeovirgaceae bacterium SG7u.111]